jgi:hypothetical protein
MVLSGERYPSRRQLLAGERPSHKRQGRIRRLHPIRVATDQHGWDRPDQPARSNLNIGSMPFQRVPAL